MKEELNEKNIPDPKEIEKEIGDFLNKKFGGNVKVVTPSVLPHENIDVKSTKTRDTIKSINFDLKPLELVSYLDQYIIKQDQAKAVLATKICTHFNRINRAEKSDTENKIVGGIKSNILMAGPTGVGKTYMIKLIAGKIGVPFVKGDATKFSETGYVGGDVEDLIRDLVREAEDDIELAQYGIVYIDEIDKIASSRNLVGADISRTGVQRALLKPMEETDVELKVPHDPISMLQEMERYQKSGKRDKRTVNTGNILFIVSGAFGEIPEIVKKRVASQTIGFGSQIHDTKEPSDLLKQLKTEDLVEYGFESEFVGRLPVRAIFEKLTEDDLFEILKSPNNPVILGKKLDFAAYGIDIKFDDETLRILAKMAYDESTGARGLISAVEQTLLLFENHLPSSGITQFPVTKDVINNPEGTLESLTSEADTEKWDTIFERLSNDEEAYIISYIRENWPQLTSKLDFPLTDKRVELVTKYYCASITNTGDAVSKIKDFYDETKFIEILFEEKNKLSIKLEEDAVDFIIEQLINESVSSEDILEKISMDFLDGLNLIHEKAGIDSFVLSKEALLNSEEFLNNLVKNKLKESGEHT